MIWAAGRQRMGWRFETGSEHLLHIVVTICARERYAAYLAIFLCRQSSWRGLADVQRFPGSYRRGTGNLKGTAEASLPDRRIVSHLPNDILKHHLLFAPCLYQIKFLNYLLKHFFVVKYLE